LRFYRPTPFLAGAAALHAAGAVALAVAPRHWPEVAGTLFASHVVLAGVSLWPQSRLFGPNWSRLPEDAARRGEVGLTFDDGPDPEVTPRVLDLLDGASAKATFFCIGRRVEARPDLAAEIVRRGHRIENHTWSHPNTFAWYMPPAQRREVLRAQEAIEQAAGRAPSLFRPPAGFRNPFTERELFHAGLTLASWTGRGYDTVVREPREILRRLLKGLSAGDVLLLHDGSAVTGGGNPVVLEVLPRLLEELQARGLAAVPMDDGSAGGDSLSRAAGEGRGGGPSGGNTTGSGGSAPGSSGSTTGSGGSSTGSRGSTRSPDGSGAEPGGRIPGSGGSATGSGGSGARSSGSTTASGGSSTGSRGSTTGSVSNTKELGSNTTELGGSGAEAPLPDPPPLRGRGSPLPPRAYELLFWNPAERP
jgi:peptidoglycan/xylan/chitin deacetylase (PgdA/CDA1 family)